MDRRSELRFAMDQPVVVAVLDGHSTRRTAQIRNASPWGIAIEMRSPVAPGVSLRIEMEDGVAFGKASYCREVSGAYYIGVKLQQQIQSLSNLAAALDELDECARNSAGLAR
jgi:hypothetical protein